MKEQPQVDNTAKMLYSSGLLIKAAGDKNSSNDNAKEQLIKAAGKAAYHITNKINSVKRSRRKIKIES